MDRADLAEAFREQAEWCRKLDSPLYHALLLNIADDIDAAAVCWKFLEPFAAEPRRSLLPLRFCAMFHRLALEGSIPTMSFDVIRETLKQRDLTTKLPRTVQTNEVARCAALAPGFLEIAERTALPLRLLEIGCSAGLNLRWDHFQSILPPSNAVPPRITERLGCDLNPIDLDDAGRLTLLSFIWPDQTARFSLLSQAIDIARTIPATIYRADAVDWLEKQLSHPKTGVATVVFHSIVLLYFSTQARRAIDQLMNQAGAKATAEAPLAWLSMEPAGSEAEVHLTIWPGGERKLIATSGYHGRNVQLANPNDAGLRIQTRR